MDLIVAVDQNWAIGKDGEQLLYLSQDLKRFKALTLGHAVILGRRTLSTFPGGRPLKGRRNLILSTTPGFAPEGGEVYPSLDALLAPDALPVRQQQPLQSGIFHRSELRPPQGGASGPDVPSSGGRWTAAAEGPDRAEYHAGHGGPALQLCLSAG